METKPATSEPKKTNVRFFSLLSTEKINSLAAKEPKVRYKALSKEKMDNKIERLRRNSLNKNHDFLQNPIQSNSTIKTQQNSIQDLLNECSDDVKKFIHHNELMKIVAQPGRLVITTRNRFRLTIDVISKFSKKINIKDRKGNVLLDAVQTLGYKQITTS